MKDTRYILRKIIIGVGIALSLMFIKSCNVNASTINVSLHDVTYDNSNFYNRNRTNGDDVCPI